MKKNILFVFMIIISLSFLVSCGVLQNLSTNGAGGDETPCSHTYSEWTTITPATCESNGNQERTCSICDNKEYQTVSALGHSFDSEWIYTDSIHYHKCTRNDCNTTKDVANHIYDNDLDENCNECNSTRETQCLHTNTEIIKGFAATCLTNGKTDGLKCTDCEELLIEQQPIEALEHDYEGVVTISPTCTEAGVMTYTCNNDSTHTYTEEIQALEHDYESVVTTSPTCTEVGVMTYTCNNDSTHTYTEEIQALEHDYESVVTTSPTCTEAGVITYTCKNDSAHTYTTTSQRLSHNIENNVCILCFGQCISTVDQLKNVAYGLSGKYILINDINLEGKTWTPIGYSSAQFTGIFDGNGYKIYNYKPIRYDNLIGLFGCSSGLILNLGVTNVTINASFVNTTGCLVGMNVGKITNCYAVGMINVTEGGSNNCDTGGLVGLNYNGTIEGCYATVEVTSKNTEYGTNNNNAGGLVGRNYNGLINNCYATGDVEGRSSNSSYGHSSSNSHVGGLVGFNDNKGIVSNCYATGDVDCYSSGGIYCYSFAGGLVGLNNYNIVNCYATGNLTVNARNKDSNTNSSLCYAGGLVGGSVGAGNSYCYTEQTYRITSCSSYKSPNSYCQKLDMNVLQSENFATSTLGWDTNYWLFSNDAHPTLKNTGVIS